MNFLGLYFFNKNHAKLMIKFKEKKQEQSFVKVLKNIKKYGINVENKFEIKMYRNNRHLRKRGNNGSK